MTVSAVLFVSAIFFSFSNYKIDTLNDLLLVEVEATTQYEIGAPLFNWQEYIIECTQTNGFDYIIVHTDSYTYSTQACGYGGGVCVPPPGCGWGWAI